MYGAGASSSSGSGEIVSKPIQVFSSLQMELAVNVVIIRVFVAEKALDMSVGHRTVEVIHTERGEGSGIVAGIVRYR